MKQVTIRHTFIWMRWVCIWIMICSQLSLFVFNVAAQEPTAIPTPTPANTPIPTSPPPTPTPTTNPASPTASPTSANLSPAPTGRLMAFRVDDEEVIKGHCARFNWVVKGDVGIVEFDTIGDGKAPALVSEEDEQEVCPLEETKYQLVVTWLDGNISNSDTIEVEVDSSNDNTADGDSSNSSSGDTSNGNNTLPPAGAFVPVTPILIENPPGSIVVTPIPGSASSSANNGQAPPIGALGSVSVLPETGAGPPPETMMIHPLHHSIVFLRQPADLIAHGRWAIMLTGLIGGLVLLVKFRR